MLEDKPVLIDDNTFKTVVLYHGMQFVFDTNKRFEFENDAEFLEDIQEELDERIENELKYQSV